MVVFVGNGIGGVAVGVLGVGYGVGFVVVVRVIGFVAVVDGVSGVIAAVIGVFVVVVHGVCVFVFFDGGGLRVIVVDDGVDVVFVGGQGGGFVDDGIFASVVGVFVRVCVGFFFFHGVYGVLDDVLDGVGVVVDCAVVWVDGVCFGLVEVGLDVN